MVTVSIFALRDAIRNIQTQYKTPLNSTSHTSPSTEADIKLIRDYLELLELLILRPKRDGNEHAIPARDRMALGAEHWNKPAAYRNFRHNTCKAKNHGVPESQGPDVESEDESDTDGVDQDQNPPTTFNDLSMDEEEFPLGTDPSRHVAITQEVIDELSKVSATTPSRHCLLLNFAASTTIDNLIPIHS